MLPLPNLEEINAHLLEVPQVVQAYESRDSVFSELAKNWLKRAEEILQSNKLPIAGAVATLRASVVSAERGVVPSGLVFIVPATSRKARDAAAAEALRQAAEQITNIIQSDLGQISEADRMLRQIMAVARFKGYLNGASGETGHSQVVVSVWNRLLADKDLASGAVRVEGLVGFTNALALLDRQWIPTN